jgi:hypothetical protein
MIGGIPDSVTRYLVGGLMALALAGCARVMFTEREPWRRDAEVACLQSGAVKEGPAVTIVKSIEGPGMCGADYPLRVAALGDPAVLGFADDPPRPPGPAPFSPYAQAAPYPATGTYAPYDPQGPMPVGEAPPGYGQTAPNYYPQPRPPGPQVEPVPLGGPENTPITTAPVAVKPAATLACPLVSKLDRFVSDKVQPAARRWFGQPVIEIRQISAYSCRGMNGNPNATISEHAFGNALDIAAFTFADGRKLTVKDGWHGSPEEQGFLRDVHGAACEMFTTVLAPGSNAYHYDHMHVDLMRRSSRRIICEPAAIPGEVAAARAGGHYGSRWRPGEPLVTGSLGANRSSSIMRYLPDEPQGVNDRLPRAMAGQD